MKLQKYNKTSSINSSPGTDSDEKYSSSSSIDRSSSVGSIPWAEDAIKKNQQTWENIEKIFRGEKDLPDDDKELRREILEWKRAFPQLRINENIIIDAADKRSTNSTTPINKPQELSDIVPPINKDIKLSNSNRNSDIRPVKKSAQSLYTFPKPPTLEKSLPKTFERDFRISSVPNVHHRRKQFLWSNKPSNEKTLTTTYLSSSSNKNNFHHDSDRRNNYTYKVILPNPEIVHHFVRMPPIINIISPCENPLIRSNNCPTTKIYVANNSSSSHLNATRHNYHLPSVHVNNNIVERSISAALNNHRQISAATTYIPFSASKLKYTK